MNDLLNKFLGMNAETRRRTVAAVVMYVINFLLVFNIVSFSNEQVEAIVQLATVLVVGFTWFYSHYFNNDYTEEAAIGTGITRQLKAEKAEEYVGDVFYEDIDGEGNFNIVEEEVDESEIIHLDEEGEEVDE